MNQYGRLSTCILFASSVNAFLQQTPNRVFRTLPHQYSRAGVNSYASPTKQHSLLAEIDSSSIADPSLVTPPVAGQSGEAVLSEAMLKFGDLCSEEQWGKLLKYEELLFEWNSKINLVSRKSPATVLHDHILPAAAIARAYAIAPGSNVLDIGTGGGFPGIPLAIMFPDSYFTLIDGRAKKIYAVNDMVERLGLKNVFADWCRAEDISPKRPYDLITGRAVTALPKFMSLAAPLLSRTPPKMDVDGVEADKYGRTTAAGVLYIKGGDFTEELQTLGYQPAEVFDVQDERLLGPAVYSGDKQVLYFPSASVL